MNDEPSEQSRFNFVVALQFALIGALLDSPNKNQPFCDGTHKTTAKTEEPDKLYWYEAEGNRHEVKENYPDLRAPAE